MNERQLTSDGHYRMLGKCGRPDLFIEDHGILTLMMTIDFGTTQQGFGGYGMDAYSKELNRREGHACGADYILRLLNLFKVKRLEEIEGRPVYALYENDGFGSMIIGLRTPEFDGSRSFIIKDWQTRWFPKEAAIK